MPSGPPHLHQRFGDDQVAWNYLRRRGFSHNRFMIVKPNRAHILTEREWDAVVYLVQEWDWDYTARRGPTGLIPMSRGDRARWWVSRALSGPLRVRDKYLVRLRMWWYS